MAPNKSRLERCTLWSTLTFQRRDFTLQYASRCCINIRVNCWVLGHSCTNVIQGQCSATMSSNSGPRSFLHCCDLRSLLHNKGPENPLLSNNGLGYQCCAIMGSNNGTRKYETDMDRPIRCATSAFKDELHLMLKVIQRFGKHRSCHLQGEHSTWLIPKNRSCILSSRSET
jgi:hypothetical protein